jgi:putative ATPase
LQRTLSDLGRQLGDLRDAVMARAQLQRHHVTLDLRAGSGLLLWEALRRTPEGGGYALAWTEQETRALAEMAAALPELRRPVILQGDLAHLPELIASADPALRFDRILGRNALGARSDKPALIAALPHLLRPEGRVILAEAIPRRGQRLYALVDVSRLGEALAQKLIQAEEAIYAATDDPMVDWDANTLVELFAHAGFDAAAEVMESESQVRITDALLHRWFASAGEARPSYRQRLAEHLSPDELVQVEALFRGQLRGRTSLWRASRLILTARRGDRSPVN